MTGKITEMSKIKQLLIMHRDGISNHSIARVLGGRQGRKNGPNPASQTGEKLASLLVLFHSSFCNLKNSFCCSISRRSSSWVGKLPLFVGKSAHG